MLAERKMKIANAIGTEFHRCVEQWINTGDCAVCAPTADGIEMPSLIPRILGMMDSWVKWARHADGFVSDTEMQVVSLAHVYSGTLDAVGVLDGKRVIFDWKTSSRIYGSMQLQLAAYAQAYNEEYVKKGMPVKDGIIVHVSKDKPDFKLTTKLFKLGKRPFKQFLKLREMFDEIHANAGVVEW